MGVRDMTAGACWAVAAATAALLWSLLDTPPSWDKDFRKWQCCGDFNGV
jgi:hypothetical protein